MKKWLVGFLILLITIIIVSVIFLLGNFKERYPASPLIKPFFEKPLDKYTIENLRKRGGIPSEITFSGNKFYYSSDGKKISGIINGATQSATVKPAILLLHGSADEGEYFPGFGTQKVAEVLAKNGYVTFAPDFLGYGESDPDGHRDDFENRFLTYTTNMDLIASICHAELVSASLANASVNSNKLRDPDLRQDDSCKLMLWGHSNGGQIALTILTILPAGRQVPTVLWNPVTKSFPYNILYYTDGYKDEGLWLRKATADFEKDYDVNKYSFDKYLDSIKAPIFIQQGEADEWVPVRWNRDFNFKFQILNFKLVYKEYVGADHNMVPKWNEAVKDTLNFFNNEK